LVLHHNHNEISFKPSCNNDLVIPYLGKCVTTFKPEESKILTIITKAKFIVSILEDPCCSLDAPIHSVREYDEISAEGEAILALWP
jgi:hypothetical protein